MKRIYVSDEVYAAIKDYRREVKEQGGRRLMMSEALRFMLSDLSTFRRKVERSTTRRERRTTRRMP